MINDNDSDNNNNDHNSNNSDNNNDDNDNNDYIIYLHRQTYPYHHLMRQLLLPLV